MNNERRKRIVTARELLEQMQENLTSCQEAEQEAYDNMPPGLQETERGLQIQANADALAEAVESIQGVLDTLEDVN